MNAAVQHNSTKKSKGFHGLSLKVVTDSNVSVTKQSLTFQHNITSESYDELLGVSH